MTLNPVKFSPIYEQAMKLGARFTEVAGWRVPLEFTASEDEVAVAHRGIVLVDASASRKILVEGEHGQQVFNATDAAMPIEIGKGMAFGAGYSYRLRADQFFFHLPPSKGKEVLQRLMNLTQKKEFSGAITDVTHGWAELLLAGPETPTLLSRLCGLNFMDDSFPDLTAQQSGVAKTRQLIIRRDFKIPETPSVTAYSLIGDRSLAAYLWRVLLESGHDLDIIPAGHAAYSKLSLVDS